MFNVHIIGKVMETNIC